jgi:hypothetical protein
LPSHSAGGGENLSVNDRESPCAVPVCCGCYNLHATLNLAVTGTCVLSKAPSVEFADGALDPIWISYKEPFHGAVKKDFGLQLLVRLLVEDCEEPEGNGKEPEKVPLPKPEPMPPVKP